MQKQNTYRREGQDPPLQEENKKTALKGRNLQRYQENNESNRNYNTVRITCRVTPTKKKPDIVQWNDTERGAMRALPVAE